MTFLIVANFKSHQTQSDLKKWLDQVAPSPNVLIAPAFPHLPLAVSRMPNAVCSQDVSPFPPGSYTGAVSAIQLQDLGVSHCLIGHSERRRYFHETSSDVANKARELVAVGITPIICLRAEDIVPDHSTHDESIIARSYYCYEPPSDIGGTVTAPIEDIHQVTSQIKQTFGTPRVMYGGSVNTDNISSLFSLDLAGVLVATASLNPQSFNQLISAISHAPI